MSTRDDSTQATAGIDAPAAINMPPAGAPGGPDGILHPDNTDAPGYHPSKIGDDGRILPGEFDITEPWDHVRWIRDYLGVTASRVQRQIIASFVLNQKTLVYGGNGFGKSFILACLTLCFLFTRGPASILATSGTYGKLRRTYCRPIEDLHKNAPVQLAGTYKQSPPRIDFDGMPDQLFEAASPKDPGELEGTHNEHTMAVLEEADKPDVTDDVFDAMESLVTDSNDKIIAVANPPETEANSVAMRRDDGTWNTLRYSAFESHNIEHALGIEPAVNEPIIPSIVTESKLIDDWRSYNGEQWPGLERALQFSDPTSPEFRQDLGKRWYRRRAGIIPPQSADIHRPITAASVEAAYDESVAVGETSLPVDSIIPVGIGYDVARMGGDSNAVVALYRPHERSPEAPYRIAVLDVWSGEDHGENESHLRELLNIDAWNPRGHTTPLAIDATPEGSGLADNVIDWYPPVYRFDNGRTALDNEAYKDHWAEGLDLLGDVLSDGTRIVDRRLREELFAAARTVSYDEKFYDSRGTKVYKATKKDAVKDELDGRSPDLLDAAIMAAYAADADIELTHGKRPRGKRPRSGQGRGYGGNTRQHNPDDVSNRTARGRREHSTNENRGYNP